MTGDDGKEVVGTSFDENIACGVGGSILHCPTGMAVDDGNEVVYRRCDGILAAV